VAKDNQEPKNQPATPSQPADNPKPPVKAPPEIKPDQSTRMYFQGSEDIKPNPNLIQLKEEKKE
jgi:hypothetical protein